MNELVNETKLLNDVELLKLTEEIVGTTITNNIKELSLSLDEIMNVMKKKSDNDGYDITNNELEKLLIRLPVLIYETNNILMNAGLKEDLSKVIKQVKYNELYVIHEGTIQDKKSMAELGVKEEQLLESVWKRTVKILSQKIEIAESFLNAVKKIYSKRIDEMNLSMRTYE